jgi:GTPase Era involved in 16S rRNA processing
MISPAFEIKVALLGHVSVGKTTVLNALFQEQFSEVSMKRTTAGINHFRVSSTTKSPKIRKHKNDDCVIEADSCMSSDSDETCVTSKQVLAEIIQDNKILRQSKKIQEKTFDVVLDEPLVKMRNDTRLVFIDIPGINEAHSQQLYLDYVKDSWDGFDCVVVVIDANSGANTEEQVNLINLVQEHTKTIKDIPVIILCNKVDNPNSTEVLGLVSETRQEVERIFAVDDREKALEQALKGVCATGKKHASPCFIPVSAENAFLYRLVSRVQLGDYNRLDEAYLEKIGHKECGENMWPELSTRQKHDLVFKVVSDLKKYQSRIEKSNFDKVMKVLDFFLGGDLKQEAIIEKQLKVAMSKLSIGDGMVDNLCKIYDRSAALGKPTTHLKDKFWKLYTESKDLAFTKLMEDVKEISSLHTPMAELVQYATALHQKVHMLSTAAKPKEDDYAMILQEMKALIRRQSQIVLEKEASWIPVNPDPKAPVCSNFPEYWTWQGTRWYNRQSGHYCDNPQGRHPAFEMSQYWTWDEAGKVWRNRYANSEESGTKDVNPATQRYKESVNWGALSPHDWNTIISSMLLVSGKRCFFENFGKETVHLGWLSRTGRFTLVAHCFHCKTTTCGCIKVGLKYKECMEGRYVKELFVPTDKAKYDRAVQVVAPDALSDPDHWGHLGWMFCEFMRSSQSK